MILTPFLSPTDQITGESKGYLILQSWRDLEPMLTIVYVEERPRTGEEDADTQLDDAERHLFQSRFLRHNNDGTVSLQPWIVDGRLPPASGGRLTSRCATYFLYVPLHQRGSSNEIAVYDLEQEHDFARLVHARAVLWAAWSGADNHIGTITDGSVCTIWHRRGSQRWSTQIRPGTAIFASFAFNGSFLAVVTMLPLQVVVLHERYGHEIARLELALGPRNFCMTWMGTPHFELAIAVDQSVYLWDFECEPVEVVKLKRTANIEADRRLHFKCVRWNRDRDILSAELNDGTLLVWKPVQNIKLRMVKADGERVVDRSLIKGGAWPTTEHGYFTRFFGNGKFTLYHVNSAQWWS